MSGEGVSAWVHQIISGLPDISFAIIFIGGEQEMYGPAQYQFPPNVTHVETHYLLHPAKSPKAERAQGQPPGVFGNGRVACAHAANRLELSRRGI